MIRKFLAIALITTPIAICFPGLFAAANQFFYSPDLVKIARNNGLSSPSITVCNLSGKCLNYRGNSYPQSAASLIKVPIAIALLQKLSEKKISLSTPTYIHPNNYTEEDYSDIKVGKSYPWRYLLTQLIAYSSNIAANQIIDYLGWNYINRVLANLGYPNTRVAYKFTGEVTAPRRNQGWASNRITTNELTAMMMKIYNRQRPEYSTLVSIFSRQADRDLGWQALQGSTSRWLGEKTGENSRVRGTTLAVEIKNKIYLITVTENNGKKEQQIRRCIREIVSYIAKNNGI
ncbi:MAG TPA: serine hydrolase [Leptolyngbyaceae cyanobacterium]